MDDTNPEQRAYMRLAAELREQVVSGLRGPGSQLPTIEQLCTTHRLSRQTCGRALQILQGEGLIYRVHGLGYYVAAPPQARTATGMR
jgi:DNA-binding GntR family transcriptional regulator